MAGFVIVSMQYDRLASQPARTKGHVDSDVTFPRDANYSCRALRRHGGGFNAPTIVTRCPTEIRIDRQAWRGMELAGSASSYD